MKLHFLDHMVDDVRGFEDISVLDASAYEQFNVHMERADRGSSRRRATPTQETVVLMELQGTVEQDTTSTEVRSSTQSVVHRRFSECMGKGGG